MDGLNGTFIPLSNPAVSGERVYIIAAFKPSQPVSTIDVHVRLYAIDVRSIMVGRIKVIWFYDLTLHESNLPYLTSEVTECIGRSDPTELQAGSVLFEEASSTVVAVVNHFGAEEAGPQSNNRWDADPSNMKSVMISLTDNGDSYTVNFGMLPSPTAFQAVAYASPNFTVSECNDSSLSGKGIPPPQVPSMWISRFKSGSSLQSSIEKIDVLTGSTIHNMDKIEELQNITVTSKLALFYNDKLMRKLYCNGSKQEAHNDSPLMPLMFGYHNWKDSTNYIGAVDVSGEQPEFLWSVSTFDDNAPVVGQITTVGKDRDTMMALTTTHGAYFYVLFAEKN